MRNDGQIQAKMLFLSAMVVCGAVVVSARGADTKGKNGLDAKTQKVISPRTRLDRQHAIAPRSLGSGRRPLSDRHDRAGRHGAAVRRLDDHARQVSQRTSAGRRLSRRAAAAPTA